MGQYTDMVNAASMNCITMQSMFFFICLIALSSSSPQSSPLYMVNLVTRDAVQVNTSTGGPEMGDIMCPYHCHGEDYQQWTWNGDQLVNLGTGYNLTVGGYDSWVYQMWTESGGPVFSLPMEDRMVLIPRGRSVQMVREDSQLEEFWIFYN